MTTTLKSGAAGLLAGVVVLALLMLIAGQASASEVTGTLSSSAATGSVATGTVTGGTGNTISGTVIDGSSGGGGGGSSRRSGGSGSVNNPGDVLGASTDVPSGVGGGGGFPGVPNTGAGGDPLLTLTTLLASLAVFAGGLGALRRYRS
jgi:hypothetical protein